MQTGQPQTVAFQLPPTTRVAVVAARFNAHIVDELLAGCVKRLEEIGISGSHVDVHRVPGAFELPLASRWLAESRRYQAVIALGCVIRGQTAHFEYVAGNCASGLAQVALETKLPVVFGVLTTETEDQARDRAGGAHGHAGTSAADTAAEMIQLGARIREGM